MRSLTKKTIRLSIMMAASLSVAFLTACGGSSSKSSDPITTLPNCPDNFYYNQSTNVFQFSASDTRECEVLNTTSANCSADEVKVRVPINMNYSSNQNSNTGISCPVNQYGTIHCTTNNYNNNQGVNSNYHSVQGQHKEVCVGQNDQNWNYIIYGQYYGYPYNWLNLNHLTAAWHYSVSYHGSVGAAINSGDLPDWVLPLLGAGAGAVIGHSVNDDGGAATGALIGLGLGLILN